MTVPRIAMSGIRKRYPGVIAPGEDHALLDENGVSGQRTSEQGERARA